MVTGKMDCLYEQCSQTAPDYDLFFEPIEVAAHASKKVAGGGYYEHKFEQCML